MLAFSVGRIHLPYTPDAHNTWIILTGAALLGGGLCLAWAERNFYSEEARAFRSMQSLYTCADTRLTDLLHRYKNCQAGSAEGHRLLSEIQDLYYQVGCEALDENAEWLIQHRSRPLEPFMAG